MRTFNFTVLAIMLSYVAVTVGATPLENRASAPAEEAIDRRVVPPNCDELLFCEEVCSADNPNPQICSGISIICSGICDIIPTLPGCSDPSSTSD